MNAVTQPRCHPPARKLLRILAGKHLYVGTVAFVAQTSLRHGQHALRALQHNLGIGAIAGTQPGAGGKKGRRAMQQMMRNMGGGQGLPF